VIFICLQNTPYTVGGKKVNHGETDFLPVVVGLFNKIEMGVLLLKTPPPVVIFANRYFEKIAGSNENIIIKKIFNDLDTISANRSVSRSSIELENEMILGYTIYRLVEFEYLVCLSDISYKKVYFDSKGENLFYDRLAELTAEVAHEMGNPLTSVITTLQVLDNGLNTWDIKKMKEYVQRSIHELDRLSIYLNKMRKFSAVSDHIQNTMVNLKSVIERAIVKSKARNSYVHIALSLEISEDIMIFVDEEAFNRILCTLFSNSLNNLSHSERGKIRIHVEELNDFFIKLIFKDNGPPLPAEVKRKIFLPFYSSLKSSKAPDLAVLLKLMTRMGGKMAAESPEEGWGSKFVLYIPLGPINEESI
jgi:signal transduction histidine kinase